MSDGVTQEVGSTRRWLCADKVVGGEVPCRVSSDLHEWRNDRTTVSTSDSVKL